ncbi:hypothetical protein DWY71_18765, partial [Bacteroides sp. AF26-7BH]
MNTNIRKILNDKYGLFEKDINILLEKFTRLSLKKKETILQEGQADHYILKSATKLFSVLLASKR